jgi:hypothetical protein
MSLSYTLSQTVDNVVHTFVQRVAAKYSLSEAELFVMWGGNVSLRPSDGAPIKEEAPGEIDHKQLLMAKRPDLVQLCKSRGLKCGGTVAVLRERLMGKEDIAPVKKSPPKKEKEKKVAPVIAKHLIDKREKIVPIRSSFGNLIHEPSKLVFDSRTKSVIGKEIENGTVEELTADDINICNKYKFGYVLPENLDQNTDLANVQVDELDSDADSEDDEEIEIAVDEILGSDSEGVEDDDDEFEDEFEVEDELEEEELEEDSE